MPKKTRLLPRILGIAFVIAVAITAAIYIIGVDAMRQAFEDIAAGLAASDGAIADSAEPSPRLTALQATTVCDVYVEGAVTLTDDTTAVVGANAYNWYAPTTETIDVVQPLVWEGRRFSVTYAGRVINDSLVGTMTVDLDIVGQLAVDGSRVERVQTTLVGRRGDIATEYVHQVVIDLPLDTESGNRFVFRVVGPDAWSHVEEFGLVYNGRTYKEPAEAGPGVTTAATVVFSTP